ncbi:hypothetical protein M501DRAFT_996269 [Patellaria atrata CBS 101060]|uniref:Uncharacterized protein n=1 Tax=Patellaria atrata CBS 101060 TaxID=1346257 RepID=A0A9P4S8P5_9PEZI|nr:hypothetical protein M501DRAFT_996269 [Patellaria atrata CBS 101060]
MSEFIGSRISLISKSDIRYVGTLHEINSEKSTVALENVISHGTEGRRPDEEVPASDNIYEYIVFRGSDVKDLRIEEPPKENKPPQPPVPNDPAILGAARPPPPPTSTSAQQQNRQAPPQQFSPQGHPYPPPPFQPPYPPFHSQRFGPPGGFPGGPGPFPPYPGMPYGAPPGWYPPPGQGFPHPPGPFSAQGNQGPIGPPGQGAVQQNQRDTKPIPIGPTANKEKGDNEKKTPDGEAPKKSTDTKPISKTSTPTPVVSAQAPPPPLESKPDPAVALAPPAPVASPQNQPSNAANAAPTGPKSGRVVPAVPLSGMIMKPKTATGAASSSQPTQATVNPTVQYQNATQAATAAVAAAMAKLPPAPGTQKVTTNDGAIDNLTKKVNEMRTNDQIRQARGGYGAGGYRGDHRGDHRGRGGRRGSGRDHHSAKVEVPETDFDFQSANAKFNKQDLVKEAIATGSPVTETPANGLNGETCYINGGDSKEDVVIPGSSTATYNKSTSFFDNISSELKDREDAKLGGSEFRAEERKKNLETFGQSNVDSYHGGHRGRGRGRGFGRGRGPFRGHRGGFAPRGRGGQNMENA